MLQDKPSLSLNEVTVQLVRLGLAYNYSCVLLNNRDTFQQVCSQLILQQCKHCKMHKPRGHTILWDQHCICDATLIEMSLQSMNMATKREDSSKSKTLNYRPLERSAGNRELRKLNTSCRKRSPHEQVPFAKGTFSWALSSVPPANIHSLFIELEVLASFLPFSAANTYSALGFLLGYCQAEHSYIVSLPPHLCLLKPRNPFEVL